MSLADLLQRLLVAEIHAAWDGRPSPTKMAAAHWLEEHGLDAILAVTDWLRLGLVIKDEDWPEISVRDVAGPSVARAEPRRESLAFRRPFCALCHKPVKLTMTGTEDHTGEVVFTCEHCEACEVLTFAGLMPDVEVVELLRVYRPFVPGEPS